MSTAAHPARVLRELPRRLMYGLWEAGACRLPGLDCYARTNESVRVAL